MLPDSHKSLLAASNAVSGEGWQCECLAEASAKSSVLDLGRWANDCRDGENEYRELNLHPEQPRLPPRGPISDVTQHNILT